LSLAGLHFGLMDALAQSGCVCQPPPINPTTCPHRYNWPGADRTPDGCGAKIVFLGLQIQTWFPYAPFGLPVGGCCDGHDNGWGDCQKNEIQSNNEFWNCLMGLGNPGNPAIYVLIAGIADLLYLAVSSQKGHGHYMDVQSRFCFCAPCGFSLCARANPYPPWYNSGSDWPIGLGPVDTGPGGGPLPGDDFPGG
jgi:hypothetical protein